MGSFDDAIREHLELKRRLGALESEIERLEEEAFGPALGLDEAGTEAPPEGAEAPPPELETPPPELEPPELAPPPELETPPPELEPPPPELEAPVVEDAIPAAAPEAEPPEVEPFAPREPVTEPDEEWPWEFVAEAGRLEDPTGTAEAVSGEPVAAGVEAPLRGTGRLARSTAFFAFATGLSRIAGLAREIVAAGFFGIKGPMSAFTIAFQLPNLVRTLFADAAIQAAFVPVFTEQLEHGRRMEAFRLASNLIFVVLLLLGALSALLVLAAPIIVPLFAPGFGPGLESLTVSLSRLLFPIVVLLGVSGIVVGILNSYHRFGVFAISPFFWNIAIIAVLVGLAPAFPEEDRIYAYAIGVLVGTILQLAMVTFDLRNTPFRLVRVRWADMWNPTVRRVLLLMLPVTISLGLINFNLVISSLVGTLVSPRTPAAIDKAFRIYMLPQGVFSIAVATVMFPTLARFAARSAYDDLRETMANGMRMIVVLLVPAAAAILVLSEPMVRLVYERGEFGPGQTVLVAAALFWFAFALPLNGLFLLMTRTFFSLQQPWTPTVIAGINLVVTTIAAFALYRPFGIEGIVGATVLATAISVVVQAGLLRRELHGLELARLLSVSVRVTIAAAALAALSYLVWRGLDGALGEGLAAQIVSLGIALAVGIAVYAVALLAMRVPEARQIVHLVRREPTRRDPRSRPAASAHRSAGIRRY